jgi:hypothetical protein
LAVASSPQIQRSSAGANQGHSSIMMARSWNVNPTSFSGSNPMKVRFFHTTQEVNDVNDSVAAEKILMANASYQYANTNAVNGTFQFIKTTNTVYNPASWVGNTYPSAITKLPFTTASINGVTYSELDSVFSFSGGSGGVAVGSPSQGGLGMSASGSIALPVTWKEVKATAKEEGNLIQWTTSSEKNTKSFVVEYSYDAKDFFAASKDILAAGNSATEKLYAFNHGEEYGEMVYYRIKQIDLDGKIDYSKVVYIKRTSKLPEFRVSMYPVPLNIEELTLQIQTIQKTALTISISDLLGREVYQETLNPSGYTTSHKMNLSQLQQGTYNVSISNGHNKMNQVLVIGK